MQGKLPVMLGKSPVMLGKSPVMLRKSPVMSAHTLSVNSLCVVNGERDWAPYFPGCAVFSVRVQSTQWLCDGGELSVFEGGARRRVDAILWRVGAIRPHPSHRAALEIARWSGVPCVNAAATLLRGYDRISMLWELREAGLPLLPCALALGESALQAVEPQFPAVLKLGNLHGGWGKARLENRESWNDARDLSFASDDYASVEPWIDYARDIRVLAVGDEVWAMERRSDGWKVNRGAADFRLIPPPAALEKHTRRALTSLGADVLAVDWLETRDGAFWALESNDIPGLSGFPDAVRWKIAARLREKMGA